MTSARLEQLNRRTRIFAALAAGEPIRVIAAREGLGVDAVYNIQSLYSSAPLNPRRLTQSEETWRRISDNLNRWNKIHRQQSSCAEPEKGA